MSGFVQISSRILTPRLPELGAIKIGGKGQLRRSSGGKEFRLPEKYDHFVVTRRDRDGTENLVRDQGIHAKLGPKPTELDVRLLWDDSAANFQSFLAAYDGRRRRCWGNGETAQDTAHGAVPCTCPWFKHHEGPYSGPKRELGKGAPTCKPHGRLSVILEAAEAFGGYYVFRTTSWETIRNLSSQLELFRSQFGFLAGLPLKLVIYPATDTYEEGGQLRTSTSYKVALLLRGDFDTARQLAVTAYERRSQLALPSPAEAEVHQQALLEADEREAAEISAEFHPEVAGDVTDAEIVEEEDQSAAQLEEICRYTLELADWAPQRINDQIAKYSTDLETLAARLQEVLPMEWGKAHADVTASAASADEPELADDGEQELAPAEEAEQLEAAANPAPAPATTARPALGAEELL